MLNQTIIMGRLTKDPELRRTANGAACTTIRVACEEDYASNGVRGTDFFDCVAWREKGEFVEKHFKKGQLVVITGRLKNRSWTDKNGSKHTTTEIIVEAINWVPASSVSATEKPGYSAPSPDADYAIADERDGYGDE